MHAYVCMCVCVRVCSHVCMCISVCTHVCTGMCVHMYENVCPHAGPCVCECLHACMYMHVYEEECLCTVCHVCTWKENEEETPPAPLRTSQSLIIPTNSLRRRPTGAGGSGGLDRSTSASCLPVAGDEPAATPAQTLFLLLLCG